MKTVPNSSDDTHQNEHSEITRLPSNLRSTICECARAFSYEWSLLVTWQRWPSHHSIHHRRKAHGTRKPHGSMFYRTGVMGGRSFTLCE